MGTLKWGSRMEFTVAVVVGGILVICAAVGWYVDSHRPDKPPEEHDWEKELEL
jgi:hypothetical protein